MQKIILLLFFTANSLSVFAQNESAEGLHKELEEVVDLGLRYIEITQRRETVAGKSYSGEWPAYMCLKGVFPLLGKKKQVDDSNCFSVASTHNALAKIILKRPEYRRMIPVLNLAFERVMAYRNNDRFNFWNLLPPYRILKKGVSIEDQPLVRRPTNFKLRTRYINKAANVVEDADDTALGYMAIALRRKILQEINPADSLLPELKPIGVIFDKYRDSNRNNRHWYNYINGNDHETGAYLTWLGDEYQFKRWNIIKVTGHNATFFLPFSECYPHAYKPYIPYGSNDLDGVVNANLLSTLAVCGELDAEGVESAVSFIEKKSKRKRYDRVGIYYPNRYHFAYAVSEAYARGVTELKTSTDYLLQFLLETQDDDGGWSSRRVVNKRDRLQSTAYALNALINIGGFEENKSSEAVEKAIRFLLENSLRDENGIHWKGGVFFSGGTVVRNCLYWRSDAYTTVIILNAFLSYSDFIGQKFNIANN